MAPPQSRRTEGFSLVELMVSMAVLLVVSGAAFSAVNRFQKNHGSAALKTDMDSGLRSAAELLTQEIGQAGSLPTPAATHQLTTPVIGSPIVQLVNLDSTAGMFGGQQLLVDTGGSQETVTIQVVNSATSLTGVFNNSHNGPPNAAPVFTPGVLPQGILYPTANGVPASNGNQLELIGDINGDGTLVYVEYDCNPNAAGTGTLTRSITPLPSVAQNAPTVLLQNLVNNPGAAPCFTYATNAAQGFTFVTNVGITLSLQSSTRDPQTGAFQTLTKSFLNIEPRNILAGYTLARAYVTSDLQPTPAGVPLPMP